METNFLSTPTAPTIGQPLSAQYLADISAALRALRVFPGVGIHIEASPDGVIISADSSSSGGSSALDSGDTYIFDITGGDNIAGYTGTITIPATNPNDPNANTQNEQQVIKGTLFPIETLCIYNEALSSYRGKALAHRVNVQVLGGS